MRPSGHSSRGGAPPDADLLLAFLAPVPVVVLELAALALSGTVTAAQALGGRVPGLAAAALHGAGAASGIALLTALAPSEWLLGLALIPLTALAAVHFTRAVLRRLGGWRGWAATAVLLFGAAALLLSQTPRPLTRGLAAGEHAAPVRTIQPGAGRPVRG